MSTTTRRAQSFPDADACDDDTAEAMAADDTFAWLTNAAFVLALGLVAARVLMLETLRDPFEVAPGSDAVPGGPGPGTGLVLNLLSCLPALMVLARRAVDSTFVLRLPWSHLAFALLAAWAGASVGWSDDKFSAAIGASYLVTSAALMWATAQLVRSWLRLRVVAGICFGLLLALLAHGLIYRFVELPDLRRAWDQQKDQILEQRGWKPDSFEAVQFELKIINQEMIGFSASPNTYAALIVLLTVVSLGVAAQRLRNRDEIAWALGAASVVPVSLLVLWFTRSRTALAVFVLAAGILATLRFIGPVRARHSRKVYFAAAGLFVLGIAAVVGHGAYHGTLFHDSLNFRWRYWVGSWRVFLDHPILGVGWNNFGGHYLAERLLMAAEEIKDPHNMLVRAFVELGIVGGLLMVAWLARLWWELTRPVTPPPPPPGEAGIVTAAPFSRAILFLSSIALVAVGVNVVASVDTSEVNYAFVEIIKRALYGCLLVGGAAVVALRSGTRQDLDDRPSPWVLYGLIVALGGFLLHSLLDVALFEVGPMLLVTTLIGCAGGARAPRRAVRRRGRAMAAAALAAACVGLVLAGVLFVLPVGEAQSLAFQADDDVRKGRLDAAVRGYRAAHEKVPYNADYAFRAARAMIIAQYPPEQTRAMLDRAAAGDPTSVPYRLTRAQFELHGAPQPDERRVIDNYEAVFALNPNDVRLRLEYAAALERLGRDDEALQQYRLALEYNDGLHPDEPKRLKPDRLAEVRQRIEALTARSAKP